VHNITDHFIQMFIMCFIACFVCLLYCECVRNIRLKLNSAMFTWHYGCEQIPKVHVPRVNVPVMSLQLIIKVELKVWISFI